MKGEWSGRAACICACTVAVPRVRDQSSNEHVESILPVSSSFFSFDLLVSVATMSTDRGEDRAPRESFPLWTDGHAGPSDADLRRLIRETLTNILKETPGIAVGQSGGPATRGKCSFSISSAVVSFQRRAWATDCHRGVGLV